MRTQLHYYTFPGSWENKGPATGLRRGPMGLDARSTRCAWTSSSPSTRDHGQATIREKRVGLYVDEWGTWYDPEPGATPGFLYQQNTLRDALVAALDLNIFHRHADRVRMPPSRRW